MDSRFRVYYRTGKIAKTIRMDLRGENFATQILLRKYCIQDFVRKILDYLAQLANPSDSPHDPLRGQILLRKIWVEKNPRTYSTVRGLLQAPILTPGPLSDLILAPRASGSRFIF